MISNGFVIMGNGKILKLEAGANNQYIINPSMTSFDNRTIQPSSHIVGATL